MNTSNVPNINIEKIDVNPIININIDNNNENINEDENKAIEESIQKYENINFRVLQDSLSKENFRYELYPIDTFKKHMKNQLDGIYQYLYDDYIEGLFESPYKSDYQGNTEEYINNFGLLFKFSREVIRIQNEIIKLVGKERYNYILHIASVMMVSEWSKHKAIESDKQIRSQVIRGPH